MKIKLNTNLNLAYAQDRQLLRGILAAYDCVGHANTQAREPSLPADLDMASGDVKGPPPVVSCWTSKGNEELVKEYLNVADTVGRVDVRLADEAEDKEKRLGGGLDRKPTPTPKRKRRTKKEMEAAKSESAEPEAADPEAAEPEAAEPIETFGGEAEANLSTIHDRLAQIKELQEKREAAENAQGTKIVKSMVENVEVEKDDSIGLAEANLHVVKEIVEAEQTVKTDKIDTESSVDEALTAVDPAKPDGELITPEQTARLRELRVEAAKLDVFADFRAIVVDACGQAGKFAEIPFAVANMILPKIEALMKTTADEGKAADVDKVAG